MFFLPIMKTMSQKPKSPALIFFCLFFASQFAIYGQDSQDVPGQFAELPRQFREIALGMGLDELKAALQEDNMFSFRGDRDVSFLPVREESLVETTGPTFIRRAFFQLRDGNLFIMALTLNTEMMDHYSMFTNFLEKYGHPLYLNPREAVWETETTRIALERPLTVKYIDKVIFDDILSESTLIQSGRIRERQEFLDEF
jgi:hypothetical protein